MSYQEAKARIPTLREQILQKLIEAGNKGVTNLEFQKMCVRWNSRLSELYSQGYQTKVIQEGKGIYKYILTKQPDKILKPKKAIEILLESIQQKYDNMISSNDLQDLLNTHNFIISRKGGTHKIS